MKACVCGSKVRRAGDRPVRQSARALTGGDWTRPRQVGHHRSSKTGRIEALFGIEIIAVGIGSPPPAQGNVG